ncbi:MAG: hypothetical protein AAF621_04925 [Pseudomonadota bacterium]
MAEAPQNMADPFSALSEHSARDDVHFLQDPNKEGGYFELNKHSLTVTVKEHNEHLIPNVVLEQIKNQVAHLISLSPQEYAFAGRKKYEPRELSEKNCDNPIMYGQMGLFSIIDMPPFTVVGIYAGRYLAEIKDFEAEYNRVHPVLADRYMHACDIKGYPGICAYMSGNYMSYVNDWRPIDYQERSKEDLDALKSKKHNVISLIGESLGHKFIIYVSIDNIWENDEILTDYGDGYWEREAFINEHINKINEIDPQNMPDNGADNAQEQAY